MSADNILGKYRRLRRLVGTGVAMLLLRGSSAAERATRQKGPYESQDTSRRHVSDRWNIFVVACPRLNSTDG